MSEPVTQILHPNHRTEPMTPCVGYARVSTGKQAKSDLGMDAQRERIKSYASFKGWELLMTFEDPGVSGAKATETRPGGKALLDYASYKKPIIIVYKFDRLFRSVADAAITMNDFDKGGVGLVSISEGFDTTSIYGKAMMQMVSVFAELERGMISERTKACLDVKRDRGERISRHAPYGWQFDNDLVVENQAEQCVLVCVVDMFSKHKGFTDIATHLNYLGEPTRTGNPWTASAVRNILKRVG